MKQYDGILFLDMDGVLCTPRVWLANNRKGHNQLDPICVKLLDLFCQKYSLTLVCSSAWRYEGRVPDILATHGFISNFASPFDINPDLSVEPDYSVTNTPCNFGKEDRTRGAEIISWLDKFKPMMKDPSRFIIFDDEIASIECHPRLQGHIVECDTYNGISWEAYIKAEEIMSELDK